MLGLPLLDVVIGMIFLYLLLSLVCTAVVEWISSLRGKRADLLVTGIQALLGKSAPGASNPSGKRGADASGAAQQPGVSSQNDTHSGTSTGGAPQKDSQPAAGLANDFFNHALIQSLYHPGSRTRGTSAAEWRGKPSYIPARTFALALLDLLAPARLDATIVQAAADGKLVEAQQAARAAHAPAQRMSSLVEGVSKLPADSILRRTLDVLIADARGDLAALQENVEVWYNHTMDRASGWYKRWTQWVLLLVGAVLAVASNADTISLSRRLASDSALRAAVVAQAEAYAKRPAPANPQGDSSFAAVKAAIDSLNGMGLPLGWSDADRRALGLCTSGIFKCTNPEPGDISGAREGGSSRLLNWVLKIAGLLITSIAVSLGAPFWFDMLNKVITIRAAGPSPDEKPKSPQGGPKRLKEQAPQ